MTRKKKKVKFVLGICRYCSSSENTFLNRFGIVVCSKCSDKKSVMDNQRIESNKSLTKKGVV